jgi:hypothetical protein
MNLAPCLSQSAAKSLRRNGLLVEPITASSGPAGAGNVALQVLLLARACFADAFPRLMAASVRGGRDPSANARNFLPTNSGEAKYQFRSVGGQGTTISH